MHASTDLRKFVCPEIVSGIAAISLTGQCAQNFEVRNVMVVTDPGVIAAGWEAAVAESLAAANVSFVVYSSVSPNPRAEEVMAGAEMFISRRCDALVAVGGGSVIDCAKGIGIVTTNARPILEFEGVDHVTAPMPPLICVPTTAGTGADVSQFAIILNTAKKLKMAIISKAVVPDISICDPTVLTTMDPYLTACTGIDAIVHAIEAFVSNANSTLTDLYALDAIRLIAENLLPSIRNAEDLECRKKMMFGSLEAGLSFSNASLGAVHAMAHSLGGYLDLPHGECNAMLLEHVVGFNYASAPERYREVGRALGLPLSGMTGSEVMDAIIAELRRLRTEAGITSSLGSKGVCAADIGNLARNACKDACMVTNPRHPSVRDIEVIYEHAL